MTAGPTIASRRSPRKGEGGPSNGGTDPQPWRDMNASNNIVQTEPQYLTLRDAIATRFEIVPPADAPDQPPPPPSFKAYTRGCLYEADGTRIDLLVRVGGVGGDQARSIDPAVLPPEQRGG